MYRRAQRYRRVCKEHSVGTCRKGMVLWARLLLRSIHFFNPATVPPADHHIYRRLTELKRDLLISDLAVLVMPMIVLAAR